MIKILPRASPPSTQPFEIQTLGDVLKAVAIIIVFSGLQGASHAYDLTLDWTRVIAGDDFIQMLLAMKQGFIAGGLQGVTRAGESVLVFWAGPVLWTYLAPILQSTISFAGAAMTKFVSLFRKSTPPTNPPPPTNP
jgi:hypothetical protein